MESGLLEFRPPQAVSFPAAVTCLGADPEQVQGELQPEELCLVDGAADKRRREFRAGRLLARKALTRMGLPEQPLLVADGGGPRWPAGVIGSLSHTRGFCGVMVAREASGLKGIGLDVEPDTPLRSELDRRILTENERSKCDDQSSRERGDFLRRVFCAKESIYKCQFPLTNTFLGFHDVEVDWDSSRERFQARIVGSRQENLSLEGLTGTVWKRGGFVLAACWVSGDLKM